MQIPVLVERVKGHGGYRARGTEPFAVSAKIDDWKKSIEEYREKVENDPDAL